MKLLTQKELNKKYKNIYIEFLQHYDYSKRENLYEIIKKSKTIRENMTLGQDVGTAFEFRR